MDADLGSGIDADEASRVPREPEEIAPAFAASDQRWRTNRTLDLGGGIRWAPDLVRDDESALLHIHVADRLREYALRRFQAALTAGVEVHVALDLPRLYEPDLLESLAASDAHVHILDRKIEV